MEYNRIVAVTGLPGLFEVVSSKTDGAIVRSLEDKSTKFISSRVHNLSHLESIEVYTTGDNVQLTTIFQAMEEKGGDSLPDSKDNKALRAYFEKVFPELDFERVYSSDMKKMVKWYEVIKANNIPFTSSEEEGEEEETEVEESEAPAKKAPAKKAAAKKTASADKDEEAEAPAKKAPAKKAAAKKESAAAPAKKAAAKKKKD